MSRVINGIYENKLFLFPWQNDAYFNERIDPWRLCADGEPERVSPPYHGRIAPGGVAPHTFP
jgi:hypothetical protein